MPINHRAVLASIRRFDQLIAYLRDEMGWPISQDSFFDVDDLFYDFTPDELGIDRHNAAKIQEIRRLRPLSVNQPWGIFFVKFEPKRLPVVALRRILSQVALKKRSSANSAERAAWSAEDLLFISNYGEGESRQISFAYFSQNKSKKDLPTLKVLGWDNLDTALHLDHVAVLLTERLAWPDDEKDITTWREQWCSAFTLRHREVITTSKNLAIELAGLARSIRDRINTVLVIENENGPVTMLMTAFKEALVHNLDKDGFADMYAQTIAYGLLSARIANPVSANTDSIVEAMPITQPFLKELLETFLEVGERKSSTEDSASLNFDELGVAEVVELLDVANMRAVIRDFGDKNPQEDPVIHFYELFLTEYDSKKRLQRGVFYTPRPIVSFIVRSVDKRLRTEFGLEDGLADTSTWGEMIERIIGLKIPQSTPPEQSFVQILDPATGTGTFLVEVIGIIHKTMSEKWHKEGNTAKDINELWNNYVPEHLLPRLTGYELMMAPYSIAHMKIGLKLKETGYQFKSKDRVRVFLTNSLESAQDFSGTLTFAIPALAHEAETVNSVKRDHKFTVVIGNPPYSTISGNLSAEAISFVEPFRYVNGKRLIVKAALAHERNLQDDYVKYFGLLCRHLWNTGVGIGSYISNFGFLDSQSLAGMRCSILNSFDLVDILDLGGRVADHSSEAKGDENVFEISQGVAISILAKRSSNIESTMLRYKRLRGSQKSKLSTLNQNDMRNLSLDYVKAKAPYYLFLPTDARVTSEFEEYYGLEQIFLMNSGGIITSRDNLAIAMNKQSLIDKVLEFSNTTDGDLEVREKIGYSVKAKWNETGCKRLLRAETVGETRIKKIYYRPMDERYIYYFLPLLDTPSRPVSEMVYSGTNLVLATPRLKTPGEFCHILISRWPVEKKACTHDMATQMFPVFDRNPFNPQKIRLNINNEFLEMLPKEWKQSWTSDETAGIEITSYIYSLIHSPTYRHRYIEPLRGVYPRVPITNNIKMLERLVSFGKKLIELHLLEFTPVENFSFKSILKHRSEVEKVSYSENTVWINKKKTNGFKGVSEEIWNFNIGGYQVCKKWLIARQAKGGKNPRPGHILTEEDINHYQKIIVAISKTIRIMGEIDIVINENGGWPGAFQTGKEYTEDAEIL
ncbi:hypothetical protein HN803_08610 [candidate division WWE3 bacterium]|jgi:predicted helicase|nr:hypothetical protein [candidate division WWE3 bacterium]